MADSNYIASVDIGSSKIVVLIADRLDDGLLEVVGHAKGVSKGVKKGQIVNVEEVALAIKKVVNKAINSCNSNFDSVVVNISDPNIRVFNLFPDTHVSSGKVKKSNVEAVIKNVESRKFRETEKCISRITHHYTLDKDLETNQGVVVKQPIGKNASTLEASVHVVVISKQRVNDIEKSIELCHLKAHKLVMNSMASSEPYLIESQKDNGVCLIDIGSGVMDLSIFTNGGLFYSTTIPVGADQITIDIADAFDTSFEEAERLKLTYGQAQVKMLVGDRLICFEQVNDAHQYYLSHESLIEVIEESYKTLLLLIKKKINDQDKNLYRLIKSFLLVGGGAKIEGCENLALSCLNKRVKIGHVNREIIRTDSNSISSNDDLLAPEYACALGLLLFNDNERTLDYKEERSAKSGVLDKLFKSF